MKTINRLAIALIVFLSGAVLVPYAALPTESFSWERYADAYQPQPHLDINHLSGKPGSFFKVTGSDYPANSTANVTINGTSLGTLPTDSVGGFEFELDTTNADEGNYFVTAATDPNTSATVEFRVDSSAPAVWSSEGSPTLFNVPAGVAFSMTIYMPLIFR